MLCQFHQSTARREPRLLRAESSAWYEIPILLLSQQIDAPHQDAIRVSASDGRSLLRLRISQFPEFLPAASLWGEATHIAALVRKMRRLAATASLLGYLNRQYQKCFLWRGRNLIFVFGELFGAFLRELAQHLLVVF